jgi:hypothetical protein
MARSSDTLRATWRSQQEQREAIHAELTSVSKQTANARSLLDANLRNSASAVLVSEETFWRAKAELPKLEQREAELRLEACAQDRRTETARQAVLTALDAEYQHDLVPLRAAAVQALRPAMVAMAMLAQRQHEHAEATGRPFTFPVYMPGLLPEADTAASIWLEAMGTDE